MMELSGVGLDGISLLFSRLDDDLLLFLYLCVYDEE